MYRYRCSKKKGMIIPILLAVVLAAAVGFVLHFLGEKYEYLDVSDFKNLDEDGVIKQIGLDISRLTDSWYDEDGYIKNNENMLMEAGQVIYSYAKELQTEGIIKECSYCEEGYSVAFELLDGGLTLYMPSIEGCYSGGDFENFGVMAIDTTGNITNSVAKVEDVALDVFMGLETAGSYESADYIYESVDEYIDYHEFGYQDTYPSLIHCIQNLNSYHTRAVFWRGHGGIFMHPATGKRQVALCLGESFQDGVDGTRAKYEKDWKDNRITNTSVRAVSYICVTNEFFEEYLPEVYGGMFFCGSCMSYRTDSLAKVFIGKGFDAYIGAKNSIEIYFSDVYMGALAEALCEKEEDGSYIKLTDAIVKATKKAGSADQSGVGFDGEMRDGSNPFRLVPVEKLLRIHVKDRLGNRISNALITAQAGNKAYKAIEMDDYYILRIPADTYQLKIEAEKYETLDAVIRVSEKDEITYELRLAGTLSGSAVDSESGNPVSDAVVRYKNAVDGSSDTVLTLQDGTFEITDMDSGDYTISISKAGYLPREFQVSVNPSVYRIIWDPVRLEAGVSDYLEYEFGDIGSNPNNIMYDDNLAFDDKYLYYFEMIGNGFGAGLYRMERSGGNAEMICREGSQNLPHYMNIYQNILYYVYENEIRYIDLASPNGVNILVNKEILGEWNRHGLGGSHTYEAYTKIGSIYIDNGIMYYTYEMGRNGTDSGDESYAGYIDLNSGADGGILIREEEGINHSKLYVYQDNLFIMGSPLGDFIIDCKDFTEAYYFRDEFNKIAMIGSNGILAVSKDHSAAVYEYDTALALAAEKKVSPRWQPSVQIYDRSEWKPLFEITYYTRFELSNCIVASHGSTSKDRGIDIYKKDGASYLNKINDIRPWKIGITDDTVYIGVKNGSQYKLYCISGEGEIAFEKPFVILQ